MWSSNEALLREAEEVALNCHVHYDWVQGVWIIGHNLRSSAVPSGSESQLCHNTSTTLHTPPNIAGGTEAVIRAWESSNDLERQNYTVFKGFKRGMCENVRDALDLQYYKQIRETTFGFKR